MRRVLSCAAVLALTVTAVACGDDDAGDDAGDDASGLDVSDFEAFGEGEGDVDLDEALDAARDIADQAVADTSGDAQATVVIDGTTYEFRPLTPGPDDDFSYSFCTTVAGSLQGGMQLVDDTGAYVKGGELDFILLEPDGPYANTGDPAELGLALPGSGGMGYYTADEIDAPASGRSASGTFTVSNFEGDTLTGTIDASC